MQVDPTLMNVGVGGTVSREISAPNKASMTMVGNPPQTLPPEFRGDVTLSQQNKTTSAKDFETTKACLDNFNHSTELSPPQQPNIAPVSCTALSLSDKTADVPKPKADGAFSAPQWFGGVKVNQEDSAPSSHSNMTSSKKSNTQMQSVQSAPPVFHCSTMFKPAQPVAFLPSTNFSSLCKITLPPALGQIAALREATASQFQKKIQPQNPGVSGAPLMRTYPYPFAVGRATSSEKKAGTSTSKLKASHSSNKNTKSVEHKSLASVVASPAIALPMQHPSLTSTAPTHYTLSPTAAICCGSALANLASQSRLLNHVDKSSIDISAISSLKPTVPPRSDDHAASCSIEPRDVPLDLSAKSKRLKCVKDPPGSPVEPHNNESNQRDFVNLKRTYSTFSSSVQYPLLPNTHRNGSHQKPLTRPQNHQIPEPKPCWAKGSSQDPMKNIPGTYVGVASPILASTLRGKDGKGTFADEFQSFAKQEFISIIDQGEHLASGEKKPSCLKSNQHAHSFKNVKNTNLDLTTNYPSKAALSTAQLSSANIQSHPKSYSSTVVSPTWQQASDFAQQPSSIQRRFTQASQIVKSLPADGSKNTPHSSKPENDKWEKNKSPLSNLASIVKQQSLETATLTGEGHAQTLPISSRKSNNLTAFKSNLNSQSKNTFEYPQLWSTAKWSTIPSQEDVTPARKRLEKGKATIDNTDTHHSHVELTAKQSSQKPTIQSNVTGNNASTNGRRVESKLAQVLEKESGTANSPPPKKLEDTVVSNVKDHCAKAGDKTSGAKELSPTKAKAVAIKQKKISPKKPAKENSPVISSKKAPGSTKEVDPENSPTKVSPNKKKKLSGPASEHLLADKLSPCKNDIPEEQISPKVEQSCLKKADRKYSSKKADRLIKSGKQVEEAESTFPRLRRGRRRADESRLDLWGFATPSPPPPAPASPPHSAPEPARRPRGRPRSTPLPERGSQGKNKNTSADADCPVNRKRQRCKNKKYQTGDYITDKDKLDDGEHLDESDLLNHDEITAGSQRNRCSSPAVSSPEPLVQRLSFTRSGSVCYSEGSPERTDKPSGKRKFKSKHLSSSDEQKGKTKRGLGKRSAPQAPDEDCIEAKKVASPPASPKSLLSPPSNKNGSGKSSGSESPLKRPIPPEVRRLIVNKNAGETLLQRAARLGYQDVVQYCLEKDIREVNRRDNAGYTALHEASSRGWVQIVQMLLKHGADVNCSAQDGTRPIHDAVASDNIAIVWLLLNHGADPTLATYSGQTPVKLAHSSGMKHFLTEYFTDLGGRSEQDPSLHWDFYSSSLFETDQGPCWDYLLSEQEQECERDQDKDCLVFEFSSEPLLPCYHVQVSLTQGFCNWFLLSDVLKRLKMSARIFRARYPHLEVASLPYVELSKQVSVSQVSSACASPHKGKNKETEDDDEEGEEGLVDLVQCVPELQRLLGSSIHILQQDEKEEELKGTLTNTGKLRSR